MSDFSKTYGQLLLGACLVGAMLVLDNLFTGPLSFVTGIPAASIKQAELALFLFFLSWFAARFVRHDIVHGVLARQSGGEVPKLIGDLSGAAVMFIGVCVIMAFVFKKDITALVATGGAGLMLLGIALRDLLLAAFTGVLLNVDKTFKPGDTIRVNDKFSGVVKQITWRKTVLQTTNGSITLPNILFANSVIVNYADPDRSSRHKLEVVIDYDTSVESAERILYAAVIGADIKLAKTPTAKPPAVHARRMERDGVAYAVSFTITDFLDADASEHAVIKSILQCMRNAGITVSFPRSEVIHAKRRARIADRSLDSFYLVQQCRLFAGLADEVCHRVAEVLTEHHFPRGATIVRAGERVFSLFIVGEGMAKQRHTNRDGSSLIERRFIATQAFGRKALFSFQPQAATVIAESNVLIYELSSSALRTLFRESPDLVQQFAAALAQLEWLDSHEGHGDEKPDQEALLRLRNLYQGQIESCYGLALGPGVLS